MICMAKRGRPAKEPKAKRVRKSIGMDPQIAAALEAWIESQDFPPDFTDVVEAAVIFWMQSKNIPLEVAESPELADPASPND